jgi:LNS2 (Lipin/Ned1/Smp2)
MRSSWLAWSGLLVGCAAGGAGTPVGADPQEQSGTIDSTAGGAAGAVASLPDVRCAGAPNAGGTRSFRHFTSKLVSRLGDPKHRGLDLVASADSATQQLEGWISYALVDKALEDEDVDVFACRAGAWQHIATARTDDEGHFSVGLSGAARLPLGMRDLFVSVAGDRTGVGFLAYVAPAGAPLVVTDVDGTLTSSENAFFETIVLGLEPGARAGAAAAFTAVAAKGYQPVYVTARGNQYTTATRAWLDHKGFPRGPVRLSPSFVTLPGGDTIDYKSQTLAALSNAGLEIAAGIGNRASDVTAYTNTGVAAERIFIELPDYLSELQPLLDAGAALGFTSYQALLADQLSQLP